MKSYKLFFLSVCPDQGVVMSRVSAVTLQRVSASLVVLFIVMEVALGAISVDIQSVVVPRRNIPQHKPFEKRMCI